MVVLYLIDKDVMIQRLITSYLKGRDVTVTILDRIDDLERHLQPEDLNLVLADFREQTIGGVSMHPYLRNHFPDLPLILLVGNLYDPKLSTINADPNTFQLRKPFTVELFFEALDSAFIRLKDQVAQPDEPDTGPQEDSVTLSTDATGMDPISQLTDDIAQAIGPENQQRQWKLTVNSAVDKKEEALSILKLYSGIDGDSNKDPDQQLEAHQNQFPEGQLNPHNRPIRSAYVVDRDRAACNLIKSYLEQRGTHDITICKRPEKAWRDIQERPADVIVLEWAIPNPSGLALYNRIRASKAHRYRPVVVLLGVGQKKQDLKILAESPFTFFIEKPLQASTFNQGLNNVFANWMSLDDASRDLGATLEQAKSSGNLQAVVNQAMHRLPESKIICRLLATYLIDERSLPEATSLLQKLNHSFPADVHFITQLAKVYHLTHQSNRAFDLLSICKNLSPENIERLCLMGEVGLHAKKPKEAKKHLNDALAIDPESQEAKARIMLADGILDYLQEKNMTSYDYNCASILNVVGVSYAKKKLTNQACQYYQSAMEIMSDPVILAKLNFNLGFCFLRAQDKVNGLKYMRVAKESMGGTYEKAERFIEMLENDTLDLATLDGIREVAES